MNDASPPPWVPARFRLTPASQLRLSPTSLPSPQPGLVSVIIPTFNRRHTLVQTLNSVLRQTYRPLEIILVDDGSTDSTARCVREEFASLHCDHSVCLRFLQQANRGAPAARNRGLLESRGAFIQYLDSDDTMERSKIASQVTRGHRDAQGKLIYGPWHTRLTRSDGRVELFDGSNLRPGQDPLGEYLQGRYVPVHGILWPRDAVVEVGLWDERLRMNEDGDMFLRAMAAGWSLSYCPAGAVRYHRQETAPDSASAARTRSAYESQLTPLVRLQMALQEQAQLARYGERLARYYLSRALSLVWLYPELAGDCLALARVSAPNWGRGRRWLCRALLETIGSALRLDKSGSLAILLLRFHSLGRWGRRRRTQHRAGRHSPG